MEEIIKKRLCGVALAFVLLCFVDSVTSLSPKVYR